MTSIYWLTQRAGDVPTTLDWLTADESLRLARLRFAKRRADWRLGRWTAERALAACLGVGEWGNGGMGEGNTDVSESLQTLLVAIEIRAAVSGAPEAFVGGNPAPFDISISHRSGRAVCAVAPAGVALGCDLEVVEPRSVDFVADYFTPEERMLVEQAPAEDRARLGTLIWSAKESALKALRAGLRLDTRSVVVTLPPAPPINEWCPLSVYYADADQTFQGWWRRDGTYLLTVVAAPSPRLPIALLGGG